MFRAIGVILGVVALAVAVTCAVDVPDLDKEIFACSSDEHCASDYRCINHVCSYSVDCAEDGCPDPGDGCVKTHDGTGMCVKGCPAQNECTHEEACVNTYGFRDGAEAQVAACKPCENGCPDSTHCEVVGMEGDLYDNIQVGCRFISDDCYGGGCPTGKVCVELKGVPLGSRSVCMTDCAAPICDTKHTCVQVEGWDGTISMTWDVCVPCLDGCHQLAECVLAGVGGGLMEDLDLGCDFFDMGCPATPCVPAALQCVQFSGTAGTTCLPDCGTGTECNIDREACAEVTGCPGCPPALAVCLPCPGVCPVGEHCACMGECNDSGNPKPADVYELFCAPN